MVTSNGIKSRKVEENKAKEHEKKASREAEEGEEENISMKSTVKLREIERGTKHLFTTAIFQVMGCSLLPLSSHIL